VFDFGYPAMDRNLVFLDLGTADRLLSTGDQVTRVVVRLLSIALVAAWLPARRAARRGIAEALRGR